MMLLKSPGQRPGADKILRRINLCDKMINGTTHSIFGDCCRTVYADASEQNPQLEKRRDEIIASENLLHELPNPATSMRK